MLQNTFGDELKAVVSQATVGVLLHALDDALRVDGPCADLGGSCVPPSRDYFNGVDPNVVMSNAFDQALTALGSDPAAWSNQPRPQILFSHYVVGPIAQVPAFSRMTWLQHVPPRSSREYRGEHHHPRAERIYRRRTGRDSGAVSAFCRSTAAVQEL